MINRKFLVVAFIPLLAAACASGPVEIPGDLTPAELIQRGQEASDRNRYTTAIQYYQAIIDRFPEDNNTIGDICAAEYEIAFIHYKQKQYDLAKTEFTDLLARYDTPDEEMLPSQFKILSQKILGNIIEIENRGNKTAPENS